eukprot:scaffold45271_cov22-Tisochrysis_lutea.AAC.1
MEPPPLHQHQIPGQPSSPVLVALLHQPHAHGTLGSKAPGKATQHPATWHSGLWSSAHPARSPPARFATQGGVRSQQLTAGKIITCKEGKVAAARRRAATMPD